jgi:hypothetical protein
MTGTKSLVQTNQYMNACGQKANYSATSTTSSNKAIVFTVQVFFLLLNFLPVAMASVFRQNKSASLARGNH